MNTPRPREPHPAYWRQRAKDARRDADLVADPVDKDILIEIANIYENLAATAEAKLSVEAMSDTECI